MSAVVYAIRLAHRTEVDTLNKIERAATRQFAGMGLIDHRLDIAFDKAELAQLIALEQVWVACSDDGETPIGFAIADVIDGDYCYLDEIDVLPEYGRCGIGAGLVKTVCDWAKNKGRHTLFLATFKSVPWNAPFYEKLGFTIVNEAEWTEAMHQVRKREIAAELPLHERVFMQLRLCQIVTQTEMQHLPSKVPPH